MVAQTQLKDQLKYFPLHATDLVRVIPALLHDSRTIMTLGPGWPLGSTCLDPAQLSEIFSNRCKQKHECNTQKKSSDSYKKARIEKRYHLTPATIDKDYGPEAITPTNSSQEELQHICKII